MAGRSTGRLRVGAAIVCAACVGLLIFAATLAPADEGLGTHRQLGLPKCDFLVRHGVACPTCGYTTAAALAARGRLLEAFIVQPAAALAALTLAMAAWIAGYTAATGTPAARRLAVLWRPATIVVIVAIAAAAWAYKAAVEPRPAPAHEAAPAAALNITPHAAPPNPKSPIRNPKSNIPTDLQV